MEREKGRVRLGGRGDYDRVRAGCRTYSTLIALIFEVYTVAILDNHNVASEVLNKIKYFLEAVYERARARANVVRAEVDREAVDACVDDALYKS